MPLGHNPSATADPAMLWPSPQKKMVTLLRGYRIRRWDVSSGSCWACVQPISGCLAWNDCFWELVLFPWRLAD